MKTISPVEHRYPMTGRALWHVGPGLSVIRQETIGAPGEGEVLVRALYGAISRGTERLVSSGAVPRSEVARMRAPFQCGEFPWPVKYGYCTVGRVIDGDRSRLGQCVFVLHPHQDLFVVPVGALARVPEHVPPARAVLGANMETALNALWDGAAAPGMRIAVIGAGTIGCLVAWLAGQLPGSEVTLVDVEPSRAAIAAALGVGWSLPSDAPADCDLVFHASASESGLLTALACAGDEASVVELSWYGERRVEAALGGAFHSRRLRLIGSQVGQVAPAMRARWSHARRMAAALSLLGAPALDTLLSPPIDFAALPARFEALLDARSGAPCPLVAYEGALEAAAPARPALS